MFADCQPQELACTTQNLAKAEAVVLGTVELGWWPDREVAD
jgi:hypothetical protein